MFAYFEDKKRKISAYLKEFLAEKGTRFAAINTLGKDVCDRIYDFAIQGKMIRGGLVPLGFALSRSGPSSRGGAAQTIHTGAAVELLQAAVLMHDDIMDRDQVRRGFESMHHQYSQMADRAGITDRDRVGESLGLCAGSIAYFLAAYHHGAGDWRHLQTVLDAWDTITPEDVQRVAAKYFRNDNSTVGLLHDSRTVRTGGDDAPASGDAAATGGGE